MMATTRAAFSGDARTRLSLWGCASPGNAL
jgi:hypothetical protein